MTKRRPPDKKIAGGILASKGCFAYTVWGCLALTGVVSAETPPDEMGLKSDTLFFRHTDTVIMSNESYVYICVIWTPMIILRLQMFQLLWLDMQFPSLSQWIIFEFGRLF